MVHTKILKFIKKKDQLLNGGLGTWHTSHLYTLYVASKMHICVIWCYLNNLKPDKFPRLHQCCQVKSRWLTLHVQNDVYTLSNNIWTNLNHALYCLPPWCLSSISVWLSPSCLPQALCVRRRWTSVSPPPVWMKACVWTRSTNSPAVVPLASRVRHLHSKHQFRSWFPHRINMHNIR